MSNASKKNAATLPLVRCAIYTRKSTEEGLEQEFNSLDAQRESAEAFIRSQAHEGWTWHAPHRGTRSKPGRGVVSSDVAGRGRGDARQAQRRGGPMTRTASDRVKQLHGPHKALRLRRTEVIRRAV